MCECGCGESDYLLRFPGPDGVWYFLEVYPGCADCELGPGVLIRQYSEASEDWRLFDFGRVPVAQFSERDEIALPLWDGDQIRKAFAKTAGEGEDGESARDIFDEEFIRRGVLQRLVHASVSVAVRRYVRPTEEDRG